MDRCEAQAITHHPRAGRRETAYATVVLLRLLSTDAATKTTVSTSAITLTAASALDHRLP